MSNLYDSPSDAIGQTSPAQQGHIPILFLSSNTISNGVMYWLEHMIFLQVFLNLFVVPSINPVTE